MRSRGFKIVKNAEPVATPMPRRINRVVLYICNTCQSVFNEGREAKRHWAARHRRPARDGGPIPRRRLPSRRA